MNAAGDGTDPTGPARTGGTDPGQAPRKGAGRGRGRSKVAATLVALFVALATPLSLYLDDRAASLDREQERRDRATFEQACADPVSAAALVRNMPAFAALCPNGQRYLLTIPTDEVPPGPALVGAYLDRLFLLLGGEFPGGNVTPYVGALHRDDRYAAALGELNRHARNCAVFPSTGAVPTADGPSAAVPASASAGPGASAGFWDDWQRVEVTPQPASLRVKTAPDGSTVVRVRVVETTPACLTRPPGGTEVPRYTGTTALTLSFGVGTDPGGRRVWLLDRLNACPVRPDPLATEPIAGTDSLFRHRSIRQSAADSLFGYAGSTCPTAATPDARRPG
ncbi:hypothetical protein AB0J86_34155 [Micromonospora sp. NPDC049559]|uniref:hypothetical protein n=1 Tax=Micromonospora sp. NPDC049559 TaxID=3155923 RepID=UPI003433A6D8